MRNKFLNLIKEDKSGKYCKQAWLIKHHPELYHEIIQYCNSFNLNVEFKQKVYLYFNELKVIPICKECSNRTNYKNFTIGYYNYCSSECYNKSNLVKEKRKQSNLNNLQVEFPIQNPDVFQKMKETNLIRYGFDISTKNEEIVEKGKITYYKNKEEGLFERMLNSRKKLFEENMVLYTQKRKDTWLLKDELELKEIRDKKCETFYNNYIKTCFDTIVNLVDVNLQTKEFTIFCNKCIQNYIIKPQLYYKRFNQGNETCLYCKPKFNGVSNQEIDLETYLYSIYDKEKIKRNRMINRISLDFYIEELNIAIEYNGLFWHSSYNKDNNFHYNKWLKCKELGIKLYHIFEDDWRVHKDYWKRFLNSILNIKSEKLTNYTIKEEYNQIWIDDISKLTYNIIDDVYWIEINDNLKYNYSNIVEIYLSYLKDKKIHYKLSNNSKYNLEEFEVFNNELRVDYLYFDDKLKIRTTNIKKYKIFDSGYFIIKNF